MQLRVEPRGGWWISLISVLASAALVATSTIASAQGEPAPPKPDSEKSGETSPPPAEGTPAVVLDDNRVESLLGKEVKSSTGEQLGRIVDVLVGREGDLKAAVIDFGGFLGVGTRKVAVAWTTLKFADRVPVLNMTADELRVTPEYRAGEPIVIVGTPAKAAAPAEPPPSPPPEK